MFFCRSSALRVLAVVLAAAITTSVVQAAPLVVTSVTSHGLRPDGRYHVRLNGIFSNPADVGALAICDGRLTSTAVHSATETTMEVSIPQQRGSIQCSFFAHRIIDGAVSGPSIRIESSSADEITGSVDRGAIDTMHGIELYGAFPHSQSLNLSIYCVDGGDINRTHVPYTPNIQFDLRSSTQLNLRFNDVPAVGARCSFTPLDPSSGRATGPRWGPVALTPNDAYVMAGFSAYHWPLSVQPSGLARRTR